MNRRHATPIILVALLLMTSTLPLTQADDTDTSGRGGPDVIVGDFHDLDNAITELTERWSIPGTQVAVTFNGTLVFSY